MTSYREFLNEQERIYDKFRKSNVRENGTEPSADVLEGRGGYIIAYRHPDRATQMLSLFSKEVESMTEAMPYTDENGHTSIAVYDVRRDFSPQQDILDKMGARIGRIWRGIAKTPHIIYPSWLSNRDTVIAPGYPTDAFSWTQNTLVEGLANDGIELKPAKMAHMTSNRFREKASPDQLQEFFRFLDGSDPIGQSIPVHIDSGYFLLDKDGFRLVTDKRFEF